MLHDDKNYLAAAFLRYRQERQRSPVYYYNEMAERAGTLSGCRSAIQSYLSGQIEVAEFTRRMAAFSREQYSRSRGRQPSRYWRFNNAGRLFLDSYLKLAGRTPLLNSAGHALKRLLTLPPTLDAASSQLEEFTAFLAELNRLAQAPAGLRSGLAAYVASYAWAVQHPEWPVYQRTAREQLARLGRLAKAPKETPAGNYNSFYLAFTRLWRELQAASVWEVESFLHWLERGSQLSTRLAAPGRAGGKTAQRQALDLQARLESALQTELNHTFRGRREPDGFIFRETGQDRPFSLALKHIQGGWWAGLGFEGFSPAALATPAGEKLLADLGGFMAEQPAYRLYGPALQPVAGLEAGLLSGEFWLLAPAGAGRDLLSEAVSGWKLLYPFAGRLAGILLEPSSDFQTGEYEEFEPPEPGRLPVETTGLRAVAETPAIYDPAAPPPQSAPDNAEVLRLARLKLPPLDSRQLDRLVEFVRQRLIINSDKVTELLTHLEAGRNVLLYGPPGCGKTRLARLVAGQLGSADPGRTPEMEATNYTLATATAEWSQYDTIGGIRPGLAHESDGQHQGRNLLYYFEPGVVARAALCCETSLRRTGRPHHLIIDEFNRANQERAFGELFTLLEYRDLPLLSGARLGRPADLFLPDAFRIIGTLNATDRNSLFDLGPALRRRFAMLEIGLPEAGDERRLLPRAVKDRLPEVELTPAGEFSDPRLARAADLLTTFAAAVRPGPSNPHGRPVGTAPLIEALLFCAAAGRYYDDPDAALQDAIMANLLPQLEGATQAVKAGLAATGPAGPLGELGRVHAALRRMAGAS